MKLPIDFRSRLLPIVLSQGVGLACGIIGVKLATHYVAPDDYGRYGIFMSLAPLGMSVVHAGLVRYVARHWAASDRRQLWRAVARAAWCKSPWLALAAAGAGIAIAGNAWWQVAPFIFAAALALSFATLAQTALQADREHWRDMASAGVSAVLRSFTPLLFYVLAGGGVLALYSGFVFHAFCYALLGLWALHSARTNAHAGEPPLLNSVYDGPLFTLLAISGWALLGMNRWFVAIFYGAATAGFFTLASTLALIVPSVLCSIILQYARPGLFALPHATREERHRLAARVDRLAAWNVFSIIAGLMALRAALPWLVGTLIDVKYTAAVDYLLPAGAFFAATATAGLFSTMMQAGGREKACGPVELSSAFVLAVGCIATVPAGLRWFNLWLLCTPLVPWLVSRPLARHYLFKPA